MKIGEIYFIRERDRIDGGTSSYVKIGMVKDVRRDSSERLSDHQTGNPRDLELHHVTRTAGPFRVERFLHQQLGPNRVRSEWFRLSDEELTLAVQMAERLAEEAFVQIPIMEEAERLGQQLSSSDKIASTEESTYWLGRLAVSKAALKLCSELSQTYKGVTEVLPPEARIEAENEDLFLTQYYLDEVFDSDGFDAKYPGLRAAYMSTSTKVTGRFMPTMPPVNLEEVDRDMFEFFSSFREACDQVKVGGLAFGDLFDLRQRLEQYSGSYSWDADVADAQLRVICGTSAGIEGQVTWNRVAKEQTEYYMDVLQSEHPEKYNEFLTVRTLSRTITRRRARRKS